MNHFFFAFGHNHASAMAGIAANVVQTISPSASFTSTPSSGFGGSPPTKTGLTMPLQTWYTHMGVQATTGTTGGTKAPAAHVLWSDKLWPDGPLPSDGIIAIDAQSIDDDCTVIFNVEGSTKTLTASDRVLIDMPVRGVGGSFGTRKIPAYAVKLTGVTGTAIEWYATVTTARSGYSPRVIGPFRLYNLASPTRTITVGTDQSTVAGVSYPTLQTALQYASTNSADQWIRINLSTDLTVDPSVTAFGTTVANSNTRRGVIEVRANGHTMLCKRASSIGDWRPAVNGLVFNGPTFDLAQVNQIYPEGGFTSGTNDSYRPMLFINHEFYSSNGPGEIFQNQNIRPNSITRWGTAEVAGYHHDLHQADCVACYRFGNFYYNVSGDIHHIIGWAGTGTEGGPSYVGFNTTKDCGPSALRNPQDAWSFTYSGSGTATIEISGNPNTSARQVVCKVDGTAVGTFTASVTVGSGNYLVSDFVTAANTALSASGWTFTTISNLKRFAASGQETGTQIVTAPGTVQAAFWIHMDAFQFSAINQHDGEILNGNLYYNSSVQLFPSIQSTTKSGWNCHVVNCGAFLPAVNPDIQAFQISGYWNSSSFKHCSFPNQLGILRYDTGNYLTCNDVLIANCVFSAIQEQGTVANSPTCTNNHAYGGGTWTGSTGTTSGGSYATDFPNLVAPTYAIADFTPAIGATLRSNLKVPTQKYDQQNAVRGGTALIGAIS